MIPLLLRGVCRFEYDGSAVRANASCENLHGLSVDQILINPVGQINADISPAALDAEDADHLAAVLPVFRHQEIIRTCMDFITAAPEDGILSD